MEEESPCPVGDLDLSFTSAATDRTLASSSSSSGRASLTLSFADRLSAAATSSSSSTTTTTLHHRTSDPQWSAIKAATTLSSNGRIHLRHLKLLRLLGSGNLAHVFLCHLRDSSSSSSFALKVIDRDSLSAQKLSQVQTESDVLSMLDHPFLPTLYARIDASHFTCLLIDYCPNGDLHSLLHKQPGNRFPVPAVRFFAAEVLVALEYLHALGIVYRDLKPENVLLRDDGHVMLSDFDLCFTADVVPSFRQRPLDESTAPVSKRRCGRDFSWRSEKREMVAEFTAEPVTAFSRSCVGTHEYLAPEIVAGAGHGSGVDWWAFGIFIHELLYGTTPFKGATKECTLRRIASPSSKAVGFRHVADGYETRDARDLIEKLLVKDPGKRLGCAGGGGAQDIKRHRFFDGIKWPLIRHRRPPAEIRGLPPRNATPGSHVGHVPRRPWWKLIYCTENELARIKRRNDCNNNCHWFMMNE